MSRGSLLHGGHAETSLAAPVLRRDEGVVGGLGEDDVVGDEHVVGVELVGRPARARTRGCGRSCTPSSSSRSQDDQDVLRRGERRRGPRRRPSSTGRPRCRTESTMCRRSPRARSLSAPSRAARDHLLGRALRVVARLRPVHDATTGHLRRADRALTGVTRALLLEGLAAGARDLAATLGRVRALASRRELRDDDLVDERDVRLDVEQRGGQLDRAGLLAVGASHVEREVESAIGLRHPSLRCGRRRCGHARRGRRP